MPKQLQFTMDSPDEKKKVVRYFGDDKAAMQSAYVSKDALAKIGNPDVIKITIEAGE